MAREYKVTPLSIETATAHDYFGGGDNERDTSLPGKDMDNFKRIRTEWKLRLSLVRARRDMELKEELSVPLSPDLFKTMAMNRLDGISSRFSHDFDLLNQHYKSPKTSGFVLFRRAQDGHLFHWAFPSVTDEKYTGWMLGPNKEEYRISKKEAGRHEVSINNASHTKGRDSETYWMFSEYGGYMSTLLTPIQYRIPRYVHGENIGYIVLGNPEQPIRAGFYRLDYMQDEIRDSTYRNMPDYLVLPSQAQLLTQIDLLGHVCGIPTIPHMEQFLEEARRYNLDEL